MGLDDNLRLKTICKILDGKVPDKTKVSIMKKTILKTFLKLEDNLEDVVLRSDSEIGIKHKMHCILFVVNATKLAALGDTLSKKIMEITAEAEERGWTNICNSNVFKLRYRTSFYACADSCGQDMSACQQRHEYCFQESSD